MKASYVIAILFTGALSMGCVAQAGTDESSQAEGLTAEQNAQGVLVQQRQAPTVTKQRVMNGPGATQVAQPTDLPPVELEDFSGADPGGNVQDDGDGKEPDPHPWHATTTARASH